MLKPMADSSGCCLARLPQRAPMAERERVNESGGQRSRAHGPSNEALARLLRVLYASGRPRSLCLPEIHQGHLPMVRTVADAGDQSQAGLSVGAGLLPHARRSDTHRPMVATLTGG